MSRNGHAGELVFWLQQHLVSSGATMILELMRWRAPPVLMLVLLLLQFNTKVPSGPGVEFVELFAGQGEASRALRSSGLSGSMHDINLAPQLMDLCQPTGFLPLDLQSWWPYSLMCSVQPMFNCWLL